MSKPSYPRFAVVTATRSAPVARACIESWQDHSAYAWPVHQVVGELGVVSAFAKGVAAASHAGAEIIACFHDDLRIDQPGWDEIVIAHFDQHPTCGLAGFGGGTGLGSDDIYQSEYRPAQLARQDFVSSLDDAESHGRRGARAERVACLDGFSQIGRREWLPAAYDYIQSKGVLHHAFDSWLGALAARNGWEVWFLPIACHHFGGQTAVLDPLYQQFAASYGGDQGIWEHAHRQMFEDCRNLLPLRVRMR